MPARAVLSVAFQPAGLEITEADVARVTAWLGYRFLLSADARPGHYPWPVALSAVPR